MTFIIAEMSASHNGSLERALAIVDAAADAGADAIKIQCWHPDRMVVDRNATVVGGPWGTRNLYKLYEQCHMPWEWIPDIATRAKEHGIEWFSSVFDDLALAELERLGCPRYKIASCEITDLPLIRAVRATGKPIIISTGMASVEEITDACIAGGNVTLLKCTAAYPAPLDSCNLWTIHDMRERFHRSVGLSDHTIGLLAAATAMSLGITVLEKHLTLSRADGGPDAGFASEPHEFAELVKEIRGAEEIPQQVRAILGTTQYGPTDPELSTYRLRRSLYYNRVLTPGDVIASADIVSARPGMGLPPDELRNLIGQRIKSRALPGQPVRASDFAVK